jgi:TolB protein
MNPPVHIALGGIGVALLLSAANSDRVMTVAQRDGMRAAKAPRMSDVSADGRFVAFQSWSRLVAADQDDLLDIYVLDRISGRVTLESGDADATAENAHARISGDGRLVVYESRATKPDELPRLDILLRDRDLASTRTLTATAHGATAYTWSRAPDISDDGRRVAFSSASTALVPGPDMNAESEDIYVVDLPSGQTTRVSVSTTGAQLAVGNSLLPSLSADGRFVAFASTASLDGESTRERRIYVRDLDARTTVRVSRAARGGRPDSDCSLPSISADGRYVVYTSEATNIASHDGNRGTDVFLVDRATNVTVMVSRAADGFSSNGTSLNGVISGDGRYVAFQSDAGNLVCASRCSSVVEDLNLLWDVFIWDRITGKTLRASEDELGGWRDWSAGPSIDSSGRVIAFSSRHPVDADDRQQDLDLFVRTVPVPLPLTTAGK